jgi:D-sedoheptulose 7-phosphate isomerase
LRGIWKQNLDEVSDLLPKLGALAAQIEQFSDALIACWNAGGKAMFAGNGGSAADAMHFAEELLVRFHKNRRALAAIGLCDPTVITCAGNDLLFALGMARA